MLKLRTPTVHNQLHAIRRRARWVLVLCAASRHQRKLLRMSEARERETSTKGNEDSESVSNMSSNTASKPSLLG
jgi:hypothetical protein